MALPPPLSALVAGRELAIAGGVAAALGLAWAAAWTRIPEDYELVLPADTAATAAAVAFPQYQVRCEQQRGTAGRDVENRER